MFSKNTRYVNFFYGELKVSIFKDLVMIVSVVVVIIRLCVENVRSITASIRSILDIRIRVTILCPERYVFTVLISSGTVPGH